MPIVSTRALPLGRSPEPEPFPALRDPGRRAQALTALAVQSWAVAVQAFANAVVRAERAEAEIEAAEDAMSTLLNTCTVIVGKYPDDGNIYEHEKWAEEELTKARDNLRAILAARRKEPGA